LFNRFVKKLTYEQSTAEFESVSLAEAGWSEVERHCHSILLTHGKRTKKAVLMFHGYHGCPSQFRGLAEAFFGLGYNVYVPRAPKHGYKHVEEDAHITAGLAIDLADHAASLASGLGEEVGAIGLSAGGNLATWCAFYRQDVVKKVMLLNPFYEPSEKQLPKWEEGPMLALYGHEWMPDRHDPHGLSYHGIAQYMLLAQHYPEKAEHPIPTVLVISEGDNVIDKERAMKVAKQLTPHPVFYAPPAEWGLGHDIVKEDLHGHEVELYHRYIQLYEDKPVDGQTSTPS
jgi:carboxylesterase